MSQPSGQSAVFRSSPMQSPGTQALDSSMSASYLSVLGSELYPAFDKSITTVTPAAEVLFYLAALREEPPSDPGSSADEGAPPAGVGWTGSGNPMSVMASL